MAPTISDEFQNQLKTAEEKVGGLDKARVKRFTENYLPNLKLKHESKSKGKDTTSVGNVLQQAVKDFRSGKEECVPYSQSAQLTSCMVP